MQFNFFKPNFPRNSLGFGIGTVTVIALKRTAKARFGVTNAATSPLPEDLVRPSFEDPNISDTHELAALLEGLVLEAGLRGRRHWSVALPSATARTAIITLDEEPPSKSETDAILDWKAETAFGTDASELRVSRIRISPSSEGKRRYFASALRLDVLEEYDLVFDELGWKVGMLVPRVLGESNWFSSFEGDSLLISTHTDGFTALLIRDKEPVVVRTVTCDENELDDEVYRLLVYYQDRLAPSGNGRLSRVLVLGDTIDEARMNEITTEATGTALGVIGPDDIGFDLPSGEFRFSDLAAPAGLSVLGVA